MKHICTVAVIATLILGTLAPKASATQGIFGTWWHPQDTNGDGYGIGFRSQVRVSPFVSFDTRASWVHFSEEKFNVIPLEATAMVKLGMVYVGGGGGYYFFDSNDKVDLSNNFGWFAVAGIDVPAGPVGIFGEVKWLDLSTDAHVAGEDPTTLKADGLGFNLGVMFGVPKL